jgi:hypothetical protein
MAGGTAKVGLNVLFEAQTSKFPMQIAVKKIAEVVAGNCGR